MQFLLVELLHIADFIKLGFGYIFPEYPPIGIIIVGLSLLLFVAYLFKSGFSQAIKVAFTIFAVLTFTFLILHHLAKILHINLMF